MKVNMIVHLISKFILFPIAKGYKVLTLQNKPLYGVSNIQRVYRFFHITKAETDSYDDYTEGYYETGTETYLEAQKKQFEYLLDSIDCSEGKRILDIGCGNGNLLATIKKRGASETGLTPVSENIEVCSSKGLNTVQGTVQELTKLFPGNHFDGVIINGSSEHFITEDDIINGKKDEKRQAFFDSIFHVLKPEGKFSITCIHFKHEPQFNTVIKNPSLLKFKSYDFYSSILIRLYSGWYPMVGDYDTHALIAGFNKENERDATEDYLQTSIEWRKRVNEKHKTLKYYINFMRVCIEFGIKDPEYIIIMAYYGYYHAWSWQFRKDKSGSAPMKHLWLTYNKSAIAA